MKLLDLKKYMFILKIIIFSIGTIYLSTALYQFSSIFKNVNYINENGQNLTVALPYYSYSGSNKEFVFKTTFEKNIFTPDWIRIIPDNFVEEIKVNEKILPLDNINPKLIGNYDIGFPYPIGKYLSKGINSIEIKIFNNDGRYGLSVTPTYHDFKYLTLIILLLIFISLLIYEFLMLFKLDKKIIFLVIIAIFFRLFYFSITDWNARSNDPEAHMEYIEYIVTHKSLPEFDQGWAFFHPPLYYICGALIYKALLASGISSIHSIYKLLQLFSIIIDIGIMLVGFFIIKNTFNKFTNNKTINYFQAPGNNKLIAKKRISKIINPDNLALISFTLFILWPSHILHSVRIGNDIMQYFFFLLAILYLIYWEENQKNINFYLMLLFTSLAMIAKSNSISLMFIIFSVIGFKFFMDENRIKNIFYYFKKIIFISMIFIILLIAVYGQAIYKNLEGKKNNILVQNAASLNSDLFVGNNAYNYLYFDTKIFITAPFVNAWEDNFGRQFFWNFFLKSSLFGEEIYYSQTSRDLGCLISFIYLLMIVYIILSIFFIHKDKFLKHIVLFLNFIFLLIFAILYRMFIPTASCNNFRFVFPILISMVIFYSFSMIGYNNQGLRKIYYLGYIFAFLFIILSLFFVLSINLV